MQKKKYNKNESKPLKLKKSPTCRLRSVLLILNVHEHLKNSCGLFIITGRKAGGNDYDAGLRPWGTSPTSGLSKVLVDTGLCHMGVGKYE